MSILTVAAVIFALLFLVIFADQGTGPSLSIFVMLGALFGPGLGAIAGAGVTPGVLWPQPQS